MARRGQKVSVEIGPGLEFSFADSALCFDRRANKKGLCKAFLCGVSLGYVSSLCNVVHVSGLHLPDIDGTKGVASNVILNKLPTVLGDRFKKPLCLFNVLNEGLSNLLEAG